MKAQRAGNTPIGVYVIEVNLTIGVLAEKVQNNLFVMDHIKILDLNLCLIKPINLKKFFFVHVSKRPTRQCVMDLIT